MATLNQNYFTLADAAKLKAPDGSLLTIAEILERSTPFLRDMMFIEGNLTTGYKSALRTELPASTFVKYYQGIAATKGRRQTITFGSTRQRQVAEMDADLLKLDNNENIAMMDSAVEHIMGMGQDAEDELIYGTAANPERIVGLAATYNSLSTDENNIGFNVIDGGGSGSDNASMWFIYWGKGGIHGFYPKGSTAGIQKKVYATDLIQAPDGNGVYEAKRIIFKFDYGLAIPNWQAAVRIANIDVSELADAGESTYDGAPLMNLLIRAANKFKPQVKAMGRPYIYCNRSVKTAIDLIANNKSTLGLSTVTGVDGKPQTSFWGVPIRLAERLLDTEAAVS
jgi:hypothetical protein